MEKKLVSYNRKYRLLDAGERVLVAVSGGVDSMVLCFLLKKAGIEFGIGHCNFRLRGDESDGDEIFVKKQAEEMGVPFYCISFDTIKYAKEKNRGIQEAARELRYEWLWEVCHKEGFQKLATAHHLDDNIETVLFHFSKGTGIRGMRGILPKKEQLIRPLLFATKKEILDYAGKQGIAFREDRSNTQDKYTRNLIRNRVVPLLQSVNPSFQHSAGKTIGHLREVEKLYDFAIGHFKNKLLRDGQAGRWKIPIEKLRGCPAPATVLYEILRPFGFNSDQVGQMLQSTENQPGSFFYSENYRLLADRDFFILEEKKEADHPVPVRGFKNTLTLQLPDDGMVKFKKTTSRPEAFPNNPNTAVLDAGTLQWPLLLRHWQPGDVFQPLGMEGRHKKLQDFFSDLKMSRLEKEKTWLLVSDDDIVWVMGRRISEANKVTARTVEYLVVEFLPGIFAK